MPQSMVRFVSVRVKIQILGFCKQIGLGLAQLRSPTRSPRPSGSLGIIPSNDGVQGVDVTTLHPVIQTSGW